MSRGGKNKYSRGDLAESWANEIDTLKGKKSLVIFRPPRKTADNWLWRQMLTTSKLD